jgi:hypothetical protein
MIVLPVLHTTVPGTVVASAVALLGNLKITIVVETKEQVPVGTYQGNFPL